MPIKRRYKRKRRGRGKRATKYGLLSNRFRSGVRKRQIIKLNYMEEFALDPGSGLADTHVFSANGIFDPNITGVGHQPMGFDEWIVMYDHITVIASKIEFTLWSHVTGSLGQGVMGVALTDSATVAATKEILVERGDSTYRAYGSVTSGASPLKITKYFGTKKFFGVKDLLDATIYRNTVSSNPSEQAFYHCWQGAANGQDGAGLSCMAKITYLCVCNEPRALAQS